MQTQNRPIFQNWHAILLLIGIVISWLYIPLSGKEDLPNYFKAILFIGAGLAIIALVQVSSDIFKNKIKEFFQIKRMESKQNVRLMEIRELFRETRRFFDSNDSASLRGYISMFESKYAQEQDKYSKLKSIQNQLMILSGWRDLLDKSLNVNNQFKGKNDFTAKVLDVLWFHRCLGDCVREINLNYRAFIKVDEVRDFESEKKLFSKLNHYIDRMSNALEKSKEVTSQNYGHDFTRIGE